MGVTCTAFQPVLHALILYPLCACTRKRQCACADCCFPSSSYTSSAYDVRGSGRPACSRPSILCCIGAQPLRSDVPLHDHLRQTVLPTLVPSPAPPPPSMTTPTCACPPPTQSTCNSTTARSSKHSSAAAATKRRRPLRLRQRLCRRHSALSVRMKDAVAGTDRNHPLCNEVEGKSQAKRCHESARRCSDCCCCYCCALLHRECNMANEVRSGTSDLYFQDHFGLIAISATWRV